MQKRKQISYHMICIVLMMGLLLIMAGCGKKDEIAMSEEMGDSAKKEALVRDINLNISGNIAGLSNPDNAKTAEQEWSGDYIYFGNYMQGKSANKKTFLKWRVLASKTTDFSANEEATIFLLADSVIDGVDFSWAVDIRDGIYYAEADVQHCANEYSYSDIRKWLNSEPFVDDENMNLKEGFYKEAFLQIERSTIVKSEVNAKNEFNSGLSQNGIIDKIFLLSKEEISNAAYGFYTKDSINESKKFEITRYAEDKGVEVVDEHALWWLRSANPEKSSVAYFINSEGQIKSGSVGAGNKIGVVPAMNLQLSSIAFCSEKDKDKEKTFTKTEEIRDKGNEWELAVFAGSGFDADWKGERGNTAIIDVITTGVAGADVEYSQISAMFVDGQGEVLCYGKVNSEKTLTGKVEITIPQDVPKDTCTLKVFAEDVNTEGTDFVSNMVEFSVLVLDSGITMVRKE